MDNEEDGRDLNKTKKNVKIQKNGGNRANNNK